MPIDRPESFRQSKIHLPFGKCRLNKQLQFEDYTESIQRFPAIVPWKRKYRFFLFLQTLSPDFEWQAHKNLIFLGDELTNPDSGDSPTSFRW